MDLPGPSLRFPAATLAGCLLAGPALAQESAQEGVAVPEAEQQDRPAEARSGDAAAHHGLITPRAQTLEAGQTALQVQDLALVGLSYGYSDTVQVTMQGLLPVDPGLPYAGLARGKVVIKRGPRAVISGRVDIGVVWPGNGQGIGASYGIGATADLHLDDRDRVLVTVGGSAHSGAGTDLSRAIDANRTGVFLYEGAGSLRLKGPVYLLGELWVPIVATKGSVQFAPYVIAPVGLRLATHVVSLDAGFILGKAADLDPSDFPIGVPWVAGTLRFN